MIHTGDALTVLKTLPNAIVDCCVTSPPYYGLRDYGVDGQIGLEETPEQYISRLVDVFREVRRVLKDDGTLWVNIGDSYAGSGKGGQSAEKRSENWQPDYANHGRTYGLKPKDLIGIPWMLAFALRADGWYLRQDIIWAKPNPMPESVTDRCTKSHEYIFLLSKSQRYYYDAEAIKEPCVWDIGGMTEARSERASEEHKSMPTALKNGIRPRESKKRGEFGGKTADFKGREAFRAVMETRNKRDVWTVSTKPFKEAHFATFPEDLIEPCILAGSREGGTVLDTFNGSGTTGVVAVKNFRDYIGIELNPKYVEMANRRIERAMQGGKNLSVSEVMSCE